MFSANGLGIGCALGVRQYNVALRSGACGLYFRWPPLSPTVADFACLFADSGLPT
jgi:hypothetical protein